MFMQYTDMSSQTNANRTASRALTGQTSIVQRMDSAAVESLKLTCRVVHSDVRVVCSEDKTRSRQSPLCSEGGTNSLKHSITNSPSQDTDMMTTKETGSAMIEEPAPTKRRGRFRTAGFSPLLGRKSRVRSSHSLEAKGGKVVAEPETGVAEQPTAETSFKETSVEVSSDGIPLENNENPMADFVMPPKVVAEPETAVAEPETAVEQPAAETLFKETSVEVSSDGTNLKYNEELMTDFVMLPKEKSVDFSVVEQDDDDTRSLSGEEVAPKEKSSWRLFRRKARNSELSDTVEIVLKETSAEVSTDGIPRKSDEKTLADLDMLPKGKSVNFSIVGHDDDATVNSSIDTFFCEDDDDWSLAVSLSYTFLNYLHFNS